MTAKEKARELRAQFGDNAKYVVLEIKDEIKLFGQGCATFRLIFWQDVLSELNKIS